MNVFKIKAIGPKDAEAVEIFQAEICLKAIDEFNSRYHGFVIISIEERVKNVWTKTNN